ncbi:MAG: peptide deformylase [Bacteroidota bacterium]
MILPVYTYGNPVLRKIAEPITKGYEGLDQLIKDMYDTMYKSDGVGLAAPQIGKSVRLIVIDASALAEDDKTLMGLKKILINPQMITEEGDEWLFEEGCLSLPGIREEVKRKPDIRIKYLDENFEPHDEEYNGIAARVIQHEYDHLQGTMFVDRLNPLKKRLLKSRLNNIIKGKIEVKYKVIFPQ